MKNIVKIESQENRLKIISRLLFICALLSNTLGYAQGEAPADTGASGAAKAEAIKSTFVLWKDGSFDRTIIEKATDYNQYDKLIVLPLRYESLEILTGNNAELTRNWEDFVEKDMPVVEEKFSKVVTNQYKKEKNPVLTEQTGTDVIIVAVELMRLEPKSYRDSSLATVGEETVETVGFLDYQIVLMDSTTGVVVGLIEDHIQVSLRRKAKNIRGNHYRAWSRTFEHVISHFKDDFKELKKQTEVASR